MLNAARVYHLVLFITGSLLISGCASGTGGKDYSRAQTCVIDEVEMGRVEHVRAVRIEGTKTPTGACAGVIVGGVAGSSVGGGRGTAIGPPSVRCSAVWAGRLPKRR